MSFGLGAVLVAMAVALLGYGRARETQPAFLRVWVLGQLYVIVILTASVCGIALLTMSWPPQ